MAQLRLALAAGALVFSVLAPACSGPLLVPGVDGTIGQSATQPFYYGHPGVPVVIEVSNIGDTDGAAPSVVTVQVSPGLTLAGSTPASWSCQDLVSLWKCTFNGVLPSAGDLPDLTLSVAVGGPDIVRDEIKLCSELRVADDVNPNNNQVCTTFLPLVPTADYDVQVTKTLWETSNPLEMAYLIEVENLGPDPVFDAVTVSDVLPAGLTVINYGWGSATTCQSPTPDSVECTIAYLGILPINKKRTIVVNAALAPSVSGLVTNCATASAPQDFTLANNTSCVSFDTDVVAPFDLQVTGEVYSVPSPGMTGVYRFWLHNAGVNSTTQTLYATLDAPPPQATLSYVSGIDGSPGVLTNIGQCTPVGTAQISCPLSPLFAPGETRLVWMSFWMNPGASGTAPACLSIAPTGDTDASNNQACVSLPAAPLPLGYALTTKASVLGAPTAGQIGEVRVSMDNTGTTPSDDPTLLFITLPAGVEYAGVANARRFVCGGLTTPTGEGLVTCHHEGPLAAAGRASASVAVYYVRAGEVTICSEVAPKVFGVDPAQTQSCSTVTVAP